MRTYIKDNRRIRFSIIMPCYNIAKSGSFIERLANQTFKSFELITINDCSTDETLSLLNQARNAFSNVFNINVIDLKKNMGPGNARNVGIKESIGEFIVFLDSDDYLEDECLEEVDKVLNDDKDIDCIVFDYATCTNSSRRENHTFKKDCVLSLKEAFLYTSNGVSGKCVRRSLIVDNDIDFLDLKRCEDFPFFRHVYLLSKKTYYLNKAFYNYVMNDNSLMHNNELIDVNNATQAFDYLANLTNDKLLLGQLFMKNCFYSNTVAMIEKRTKRKEYKLRLRYLKRNYSEYCLVSNLKPYCLRIKFISLCSFCGLYYFLRFAYWIYKKRARV